jgi:hypothetical protein
MTAEPFVTTLNVVYLLFMSLISLIGTATLVRLILEFLHTETRRPGAPTFEVEDA